MWRVRYRCLCGLILGGHATECYEAYLVSIGSGIRQFCRSHVVASNEEEYLEPFSISHANAVGVEIESR